MLVKRVVYKRGDKIGRNFAYWEIIDKYYTSSQKLWASFFTVQVIYKF
jgi:hypothetical protein